MKYVLIILIQIKLIFKQDSKMNNSKLIVLIIANNKLKTFKIFNSDYGIDNYLDEQSINCVDSNEEFSYVVLDKNDLKIINTTFN